MPDDNFLGMFGLRADEAKRRYSLRMLKEDKYYVYIEVIPRFRRDQEEFVQARIVLNKSNFMPRQLFYRQPDNTETLWDIPPETLRVNEKLDQRLFDAPATPTGWKFEKIGPNADAPPTIYRNSGAP